jgi:propionate CoA-transferase
VRQAAHITYRVMDGVARRGQSALIITERAVFNVEADGLCLIEIAPGIDLEHDILSQMDGARVRVAADLKPMNLGFFSQALAA